MMRFSKFVFIRPIANSFQPPKSSLRNSANFRCLIVSKSTDTASRDEDRDRTFVMVKPDGVQRGLVGEIIKRFEQRGFRLVAIKVMNPSREHLEKHYQHLIQKPYFSEVISYMRTGPVVPMVFEGCQAAKAGRSIIGEKEPIDSAPGTIRGDFGLLVERNIVHGSDSPKSAAKEIAMWFKPEEICESEVT